jgi:hypothetical protein
MLAPTLASSLGVAPVGPRSGSQHPRHHNYGISEQLQQARSIDRGNAPAGELQKGAQSLHQAESGLSNDSGELLKTPPLRERNKVGFNRGIKPKTAEPIIAERLDRVGGMVSSKKQRLIN